MGQLKIGNTVVITDLIHGHRLSHSYTLIEVPPGSLALITESLRHGPPDGPDDINNRGRFWAYILKYRKKDQSYVPSKVRIHLSDRGKADFPRMPEYQWKEIE